VPVAPADQHEHQVDDQRQHGVPHEHVGDGLFMVTALTSPAGVAGCCTSAPSRSLNEPAAATTLADLEAFENDHLVADRRTG
jgi:hypothetical protein